MHSSEPILLRRDCDAIMIPSGTPHRFTVGTEVTITQSLGGTYTVIGDGVMARIGERDADALGIEPKSAATANTGSTGPVDEQRLWEAMKSCYDPEIPVNVVDLGLIYDCKVTPLEEGGNKVDVKMTLTAPGCGMGGVIAGDVEQRLFGVPGVTDVHVEVVWDPIWNQSMMSDAARLQLGLM
ncbi:MAG: putative Fe-S cluster assembly protein SufT [Verrucomicrobia bacterium]|nr:putative Fe-S cluster assembly protein SufT [Verrucomicrobiota bacterium]